MLPPGGHVEAGEDPVTAVLREILEETGISAEIIPKDLPVDVAYPRQIPPPETIMVEDIDDPVAGPHEHVDLIYFCRLRDRQGDGAEGLRGGWTWVSEESAVCRIIHIDGQRNGCDTAGRRAATGLGRSASGLRSGGTPIPTFPHQGGRDLG